MHTNDHPGDTRPTPIYLSWSSGKDSAWALSTLREDARFELRGLLTTSNEEYARVAMHGVRNDLLQEQANAANLPLIRVDLPQPCSNEDYEARMEIALREAMDDGIEGFAFGDLFLRDIRAYREQQLERVGMQAFFPLWELETDELARTMVASGLRANVVCTDTRRCPGWMQGAPFDNAFLDRLPGDIDPCGENGEFHTFAWHCPAFERAVPIQRGETVVREGFAFTDFEFAGNRTPR